MTKQTILSLTTGARGVDRLAIEQQDARDRGARAELPPRSVPARDENLHTEQPTLAEVEPVRTSAGNARAVLPLVTDGELSQSDEYDVFLCHNSADKEEVRRVADQLRELGLNPWLDEEDLRPGIASVSGLDQAIRNVKSVAVFVGANDITSWQKAEIAKCAHEQVERGIPMITVLLPGGTAERVPEDLRMFVWVDLGKTAPDPIGRLYHGITGKKLGQVQTTAEVASPPRHYWTLYSTVESVKAERVSVVATAELLVATAGYGWFTWRFGRPQLMISALVALAFMVRTQESVSLSWKWYERTFAPRPRLNSRPVLAHNLFEHLFMLLAAPALLWFYSITNALKMIVIRVGATAWAFCEHPLASIKAIPGNWLRAVFYLDLGFPLELLPTASERYNARIHDGLTLLTLVPGRGIWLQWSSANGVVERIVLIVSMPAFFLLFLIPAVFYRLYIKCSFVAYSPLMLAFYNSTSRPLQTHLRDVIKQPIPKLTRLLATIVILLAVAKWYVHCAWNDLAQWWPTIPGHGLLDFIVIPNALPLWQIALLFHAGTTLALYCLAAWAIDRLDRRVRFSEKRIETTLRVLSLTQWILGILVIVLCWFL